MDPIKSKQQDDLFNHKKKYTYCKWSIFQIEKKNMKTQICAAYQKVTSTRKSQMC